MEIRICLIMRSALRAGKRQIFIYTLHDNTDYIAPSSRSFLAKLLLMPKTSEKGLRYSIVGKTMAKDSGL